MSKKFWAGLLGGTILGVLFAKKSGKQVRTEISKATKSKGWQAGAERLVKEIGAMGEEFIGTVEGLPSVKKAQRSAKGQIEMIVEKGKDKFSDALKKMRK